MSEANLATEIASGWVKCACCCGYWILCACKGIYYSTTSGQILNFTVKIHALKSRYMYVSCNDHWHVLQTSFILIYKL